MSKKPVVLMVLDGYGLSDHKEGNAIAMANTPVMDKLMAECPFVRVQLQVLQLDFLTDRWETLRQDI